MFPSIAAASSPSASPSVSPSTSPSSSPSASPSAGDYTWTLAVLPDTQRLFGDPKGYIDGNTTGRVTFEAMCQYIVDTATAKNTQLVMHLGDVVDNSGSATEFGYASDGRDVLINSGLPFIIAPGNHDYDDDAQTASRPLTNFNSYYPLSGYSGESWYGGAYEAGKSDNVYAKLTINGEKWLFYTLEFYPRTAVMDWVISTVSSEAPDFVVVGSHSFVAPGLTVDDPDNFWDAIHIPHDHEYGPDSYGSAFTTSGEDMWSYMISQIQECVMVHNGHCLDVRHHINLPGTNNGGVAHSGRQDVHANGNICTEIVQNHQNDYLPESNLTGQGSAATIHFYEINQDARRVTAYSYDPVNDLNPATFGNYPTSSPDWSSRHSFSFDY